ncbi:DegT/DnrJ/EryC1/StrS family aminotransferase [Nitrosospira sp. Nsp18]|uniref:DegT/DnrJ/EryC1/StrS family aminotransferase n=1 Tax=Nitrosospira sp. Nsp18 TaxID=1855334 RepID=UPI001C4099BF|nr:DegT/DnrJ/EryC1/StrS family aminotransferase [Nitrosospira sp. Nsp18]
MNSENFAIFGAIPEFDKPLPIGQHYFPSWERYTTSFRGIFERQYYTNQGPLTDELEKKLEAFLGVEHAICVTNATIGLMMAAESMELSGKVILPAFTFVASAQSLTWTGLDPVFCDVDPVTQQIALDQIGALIDEGVSAIMGVNLWGDSCNPKALSDLAVSYGIQLYFDSAHAFGCKISDTSLGNFGDMEIFSFHSTNILNAMEGSCICTNNDDLGARLRNIRSSYGAGHPVDVVRTSNGRMSEAQAAMALMSLEDFPSNQKTNEYLHQLYEKYLEPVPGLNIVKPTEVSFSNYQSLVCLIDEQEFGLSRDLLRELLKAENINVQRYFYPGLHHHPPYVQNLSHYPDRLPNTNHLCASTIQFPIGALVSVQTVERICNLLLRIHQASPVIRSRLQGTNCP